MKNLALVTVVGLTAVAHAQPIETITYSIEWEFALIANGGTNTGDVYATISPDIGTVTAWNTKPGTGQAGTLKCFGSSIYDFVNVLNGTNGYLEWSTPPDMSAGQSWSKAFNGGIKNAAAGQFGNTGSNLNQKVKILHVEWTETAGGAYSVNYETLVNSAKVFLDIGLATWVGENAVKVNGSGGFSVIPAPASFAAIALCGLFTGRRRRSLN